MLEKLESLSPRKVNKLLSIFWLKAANSKQPIPKPGCLLLTEKEIIVLSSEANSDDTITIRHHFNLLEIKMVQISLAGQHVRLIGSTEDTILVVFTHSKELSQDFCKALLKVLSQGKSSEETEDHPLLSGDLMVLSLDWTSNIPDIFLDNGLQVTCRFKGILADLLYIVHGNMEGPGKPSLAHIRPLLYTSVKVKDVPRLPKDAIYQFLLTDSHVVLLREEGVFHPVPRGSSLLLANPQFQALKLCRRSDIRCLFVRKDDNCLVVDFTFKSQKTNTREKKIEFRRGSADVCSISNLSSQGDSWKLCFGCTSEAEILINHLCT
ncbi:Endonuclease 8 [Dissostichus eleginoides]|uniref:Endonuclease 8 n=1 Tax=Dissostichus eleginoides TaxID=100907 RepID=A0AAD9EY40_DISEL|nr:Endonuclease 8 [Dissostichus eleginoides]